MWKLGTQTTAHKVSDNHTEVDVVVEYSLRHIYIVKDMKREGYEGTTQHNTTGVSQRETPVL